jgi:hypothetical protein
MSFFVLFSDETSETGRPAAAGRRRGFFHADQASVPLRLSRFSWNLYFCFLRWG